MIYTLPMTKKGTVTIPKKVRDELGATSKVLLIKTKAGYTLKAIPDMLSFAGAFKSDKVFTDEEINSAYENRISTDAHYKQYQK
jgi:AbrB family looped-hinge helix DNA binding protein